MRHRLPFRSGRFRASSTAALRYRAWPSAALAVCVLAGMLLGTVRAYSRGADLRNRAVDLSALVGDAQRRVSQLTGTAAGLQADIDAAAGDDVSPQVAAARAQAVRLAGGAALTAVHGPALKVTLSDAPRDSDGNYPAGVDPDDLVVHQQDVQSVVNALWSGGAEAMTIMDQRVVATSAVRCIGNTLLLQGRAYSPPFLITAIGHPPTLSAALQTEPGVALFAEYVQKYHLVFEVETEADVTLPGYGGLIRMTAAQEAK